MEQDLIISHDLGTTGDKSCLWDLDGNLVASYRCSYPLYQPHPTWAEQDPKHWWNAFKVSTKRLIEQAHVDPREIRAIGFSGQMMGCLPVSARGEPLRRAIIWMDQRSLEQAEEIKRKIGEWEYYATTGVRPNATWSLSKFMWLRDNQPELLRKAHRFLMAKDFIVMKLTGNFVTDYSDASLSGSISIKDRNWAFDFLRELNIPSDLFPEIKHSTYVVGELGAKEAREIGLAQGTRVVLGGGDGPCATVGSGCVNEGDVYIYVGTSSWISATTSKHLKDPQMRFFNMWHLDRDLFTPAGTMQMAGGSYEWIKNILFGRRRAKSAYDSMEKMASGVELGAAGVVFIPYLMGERAPVWDSKARGVFFGLTLAHDRRHLIRAVIEGVSINLRLILEAFEENGVDVKEIRMIGGVAKSSLWRAVITDCLGKPTLLVANPEEATSRGAMLAAAVGDGTFGDFRSAVKLVATQERHLPDEDNFKRYQEIKACFVSIYNNLRPVFLLG